MFTLSELENDALIEIFNIGVGHAAASMAHAPRPTEATATSAAMA